MGESVPLQYPEGRRAPDASLTIKNDGPLPVRFELFELIFNHIDGDVQGGAEMTAVELLLRADVDDQHRAGRQLEYFVQSPPLVTLVKDKGKNDGPDDDDKKFHDHSS